MANDMVRRLDAPTAIPESLHPKCNQRIHACSPSCR